MNELQMTNLLSAILDCGVADISILDGVEYDWDRVISEAKQESEMTDGASLNLQSLFNAVINIGLSNIDGIIEKRKEDMEDDDFIDEHGLQVLKDHESLNPYEDFTTYFNYLDSHVYVSKNQELYKKYFENEIEVFEKNTGFEVKFNS